MSAAQTLVVGDRSHEIRDWTRDGAVCRYKCKTYGHWNYIFFRNEFMRFKGYDNPSI